MAQAEAKDILENGMEEARKKLDSVNTSNAKEPVTVIPEKHPIKATVRKLKVSKSKRKGA